MRAQPHVTESQCPEVQHGQAIGKYRTPCLLGHEVIHDAQKAGRQIETHRIVAPPPLHHGILHAGEDGIRGGEADGDSEAINYVQIGNHHDHAHGEPVGHINVRGLANRHGHDVIQAE